MNDYFSASRFVRNEIVYFKKLTHTHKTTGFFSLQLKINIFIKLASSRKHKDLTVKGTMHLLSLKCLNKYSGLLKMVALFIQ